LRLTSCFRARAARPRPSRAERFAIRKRLVNRLGRRRDQPVEHGRGLTRAERSCCLSWGEMPLPAAVVGAVGASGAAGAAVAGAAYRVAGLGISRPVMAVASLAMALALVLPRRVWRWARLGVTAVHESGHAVVALLVGRKVTAIHLRPDSSGVTIHYGPGGSLRRLLTAAAGYPAPGLLGLVGAWLVEHRQLGGWLVVLLILGVVNVALWIRNFFGLLVMTAWVVGVVWLVARGTPGVDAFVGAVAVWFLVLGGLRAAMELPRAPAPSDAVDIGRLTHLPSGLFKAGFVLAGGAAIVVVAGFLSATW
jgi:hypothetical protein